MKHALISHSEQYADGKTHANMIEGFWSLLKRAWLGHIITTKRVTHLSMWQKHTATANTTIATPMYFGNLSTNLY